MVPRLTPKLEHSILTNECDEFCHARLESN